MSTNENENVAIARAVNREFLRLKNEVIRRSIDAQIARRFKLQTVKGK